MFLQKVLNFWLGWYSWVSTYRFVQGGFSEPKKAHSIVCSFLGHKHRVEKWYWKGYKSLKLKQNNKLYARLGRHCLLKA